MIIDTIDNLRKYVSVNSYMSELEVMIDAHNYLEWKEGKHPIDGGAFFVNITTAKGRTKEEATLEIHRRYIDVQVPLDKEETYGYTPLRDLPTDYEFDQQKDIAKFPGLAAQSYVTCKPGMFALFLPEDGHAPCIGEGDIKKAIFKLLVDPDYPFFR